MKVYVSVEMKIFRECLVLIVLIASAYSDNRLTFVRTSTISEISVSEFSTAYDSEKDLNGNIATATRTIKGESRAVLTTKVNLGNNANSSFRRSSTNKHLTGRRDSLELEPSGWRIVRPKDIPSEIVCIHKSFYPIEPRLYIEGKSAFASLRIVESHCVKRLSCEITSFLSIKPEAFKKNAVRLKIICEAGGKEESLNLQIYTHLPFPCNSTDECTREYSPHSECTHKRPRECKCLEKYYYDGLNCVEIPRKGDTSGIYKAMMVAVACFSVVVIALFLLFICNRTIFRRRRTEQTEDDALDRSGSDVYSVSDRLARLRLVDKPPTYDDVLKNDREQRGIPPPLYESVEAGPSQPPLTIQRSIDEEHSRISRLALRLNQMRTASVHHDESSGNQTIQTSSGINQTSDTTDIQQTTQAASVQMLPDNQTIVSSNSDETNLATNNRCDLPDMHTINTVVNQSRLTDLGANDSRDLPGTQPISVVVNQSDECDLSDATEAVSSLKTEPITNGSVEIEPTRTTDSNQNITFNQISELQISIIEVETDSVLNETLESYDNPAFVSDV